ncbi:MAG: hypothetical protein AAGA44_11250 [Pseudomonadota bacterium]
MHRRGFFRVGGAFLCLASVLPLPAAQRSFDSEMLSGSTFGRSAVSILRRAFSEEYLKGFHSFSILGGALEIGQPTTLDDVSSIHSLGMDIDSVVQSSIGSLRRAFEQQRELDFRKQTFSEVGGFLVADSELALFGLLKSLDV